MKRVTILIDLKHSRKLIAGQRIAIKVPAGTEVIQLQLSAVPETDSFAKVLDVFFNGRPASA